MTNIVHSLQRHTYMYSMQTCNINEKKRKEKKIIIKGEKYKWEKYYVSKIKFIIVLYEN